MRAPAHQGLALFLCEHFLGPVRRVHIGEHQMTFEVRQVSTRPGLFLRDFLQFRCRHSDLFQRRSDLFQEFLLALIQIRPDRVELCSLVVRQIQTRNGIQHGHSGSPRRRTTLATTHSTTFRTLTGTHAVRAGASFRSRSIGTWAGGALSARLVVLGRGVGSSPGVARACLGLAKCR
jgi:hypothetical protein